MTTNSAESQLFINSVDEQTRENIFKLDHKLRLMRAEVESKLAGITLYQGASPEEYQDRLVEVEQEINSALAGISSLVNLVVDPESDNHPLLQGNSLAEFNQIINENLEKISQLKNIE